MVSSDPGALPLDLPPPSVPDPSSWEGGLSSRPSAVLCPISSYKFLVVDVLKFPLMLLGL